MGALLWAVLTQGGPPLITDDPGTLGDGRWEINAAVTLEKLRRANVWEAPLLDVNYGVGERVQLKVEFPWIVLDEDGRDARGGLGDTLIGVKWRFLDEERDGISVSTYPQIQFNNPTSSDARGLVETGSELILPLEAQKEFGPVSVNAEIGFATREGGDDAWFYGLAAGTEAAEGLELIGEVHGGGERDFKHGEAVWNAGLRWDLAEGVTLLFAAGRRLARDPDEPKLIGYLGLRVLF